MSRKTKPSIVFVHGIWADGSCFSKLIPALQAKGHEVVSAQNSLDTLKGDVAAVIRALGRVSSPAILVGHSWGGTVITAAGTDERVAGLVYIAAVAPDDGETTLFSWQRSSSSAGVFASPPHSRSGSRGAPGGRRVAAGELRSGWSSPPSGPCRPSGRAGR